MAVAIAGAIIGINPFDQPDVEASKVATRALTSGFERTGALPAEAPIYQESGISLFTDARNADALERALGGDRSLAGYLRAHLNRLEAGDYFAILAYLAMNQTHRDALQAMRHTVRDRRRVATSLGFGPRFLHSTGQVYKGGPNSGVFLQITATMPGTSRSRVRGIRSAWSRRRRRVATSRSSSSVNVARSACISARMSRLD